MKNILLLLTALLLPTLLPAQNREFMELYEKYSGRDGYTTVDMSGEVFLAISDTDLLEDSSSEEEINRIMLIVAESDEGSSFGKDVREMLQKGGYKNASIVYEGGQCVEFYIKSDTGEETEFLMYSSNESEQVVIMIIGKGLSINSISRIAGSSGT